MSPVSAAQKGGSKEGGSKEGGSKEGGSRGSGSKEGGSKLSRMTAQKQEDATKHRRTKKPTWYEGASPRAQDASAPARQCRAPEGEGGSELGKVGDDTKARAACERPLKRAVRSSSSSEDDNVPLQRKKKVAKGAGTAASRKGATGGTAKSGAADKLGADTPSPLSRGSGGSGGSGAKDGNKGGDQDKEAKRAARLAKCAVPRRAASESSAASSTAHAGPLKMPIPRTIPRKSNPGRRASGRGDHPEQWRRRRALGGRCWCRGGRARASGCGA